MYRIWSFGIFETCKIMYTSKQDSQVETTDVLNKLSLKFILRCHIHQLVWTMTYTERPKLKTRKTNGVFCVTDRNFAACMKCNK